MVTSDDDEGDRTEYSTDWDSAWRTELQRRETGTQAWRPEGREPPSTEQVLKARVATVVDDTQVELQTLSRDWRFWLGAIALLSVTSAVVTNLNSPVAGGYMV